jgi:hypothetical protein
MPNERESYTPPLGSGAGEPGPTGPAPAIWPDVSAETGQPIATEDLPGTAGAGIEPAVRRPGDPDIPNDPTGRAPHPGLQGWLAVLTVLGIGAAWIGQVEASVLMALAGMFISAQGADLDLTWRRIYHLVSWAVPFSGMLVFAMLTQANWQSDLPHPTRLAVCLFSGVSAAICMLTGLRPVSNALIGVLFPGAEPNHTLRLAARLVLMGLLLGIPAWFAFRGVLANVLENPSDFINPGGLGGGLLGYVLLALAGVGFRVRRSLRATLERLGIRAFRASDAFFVAGGVAALYLLNAGLESLQRSAFPTLWSHDQAFGNALASTLGPAQIVLLGLSAGIGEEITMRGALQPRLGILLSSALFASLHVQYSWFGVLVILVLGVLLGVIRRWAGTTVAMTVHAVYDMLAVMSVLPRT